MLKNKKSLEGQIFLEFSLIVFCFIPVLLGFVFSYFILLSKNYLILDSYYLLRAHRYNNAIKICKPSQLWPKNTYFKVDYFCSNPNSLNIKFKIEKNFKKESLWEKVYTLK